MSQQLFYKKVPVFGVDIGYGTAKVIELVPRHNSKPLLVGYGVAPFTSNAIVSGVITNPEMIAETLYDLITKNMTGFVSTKAVSASIPISQAFVRTVDLKDIEESELKEAIVFEVEQSVPVAFDELYFDYSVTHSDQKNKSYEVLTVAVPKTIIDSYLKLFSLLDLSVLNIEPSVSAIARAVNMTLVLNKPAIIIDVGSRHTDFSIYDNGAIRVTGTASRGGEDITTKIAQTLKIPKRQAFIVKTRYGFEAGSKFESELSGIVEDLLEPIVREINKMSRYFSLSSKNDIENLVLVGGGAKFPGFSEYLSAKTGKAVSVCDPWSIIDLNQLQAPNELEKSIFTNSIGSALVQIEGKK